MAAQAQVKHGHLLMRSYGDYASARTSYEEAIESGHPAWAPTAMVALARLMEKQGDTAGAQDAYHRAIESGNPDAAAQASVFLGICCASKAMSRELRSHTSGSLSPGMRTGLPQLVSRVESCFTVG